MKHFDKIRIIANMAMCICVFSLTSCEHDDYFGLDDYYDNTDSDDFEGFSPEYDTYLELNIDTIKKITKRDMRIIDEAEYRMGVSFDEDRKLYSWNKEKRRKLNISSELYEKIISNIERNNYILHPELVRTKTQDPERESKYDCVPTSLSHCLPVTYGRATAACSKIDSGWKDRGVKLGLVKAIVQELGYTTETLYSPSEIREKYGREAHEINAMLVTENYGEAVDHAVCATYYDGSSWLIKKMYYLDYQGCNTPSLNWMAVSQVSVLFVF